MVGQRHDHPDLLPVAHLSKSDISLITLLEAPMSKSKAAALTNEQKIKNLRAAIIEGEASGPTVAFDMNDFLTSKRDDPFAAFTEWSSEADEKAYRKLKPNSVLKQADLKETH
jgi:hypothetical protein